jgi:hypothetical protein
MWLDDGIYVQLIAALALLVNCDLVQPDSVEEDVF